MAPDGARCADADIVRHDHRLQSALAAFPVAGIAVETLSHPTGHHQFASRRIGATRPTSAIGDILGADWWGSTCYVG
jgi:hypothetical protein